MADAKETSIKLPVAGLVIIGLVYILYAWDRLVVPIELVELRKAFGLGLSAAGFLSTVFTFGIALTAIPAGFFVIRYGTRASLIVGAVIFSICIGYPPFASGLGHLTVAQIGSGIGEELYNVALFSFLGGLSEKYPGHANGRGGIPVRHRDLLRSPDRGKDSTHERELANRLPDLLGRGPGGCRADRARAPAA